MAVITQIQNELGGLVVVLHQKLPFLGGALRDAFDVARGSHVIIMGSDLETNPDDVHTLIEEEQKVPAGIVTTSRWIRGRRIQWLLADQAPVQLDLPALLLAPLFDAADRHDFRLSNHAHEPGAGHQLGRGASSVQPGIRGQTLAPGEFPVSPKIPILVWNPRIEGESQNPFFRNFEYFRIGFKARFANKNSFWRT